MVPFLVWISSCTLNFTGKKTQVLEISLEFSKFPENGPSFSPLAVVFWFAVLCEFDWFFGLPIPLGLLKSTGRLPGGKGSRTLIIKSRRLGHQIVINYQICSQIYGKFNKDFLDQ